jgi:thiol:disulfide interchange protein DsbG
MFFRMSGAGRLNSRAPIGPKAGAHRGCPQEGIQFVNRQRSLFAASALALAVAALSACSKSTPEATAPAPAPAPAASVATAPASAAVAAASAVEPTAATGQQTPRQAYEAAAKGSGFTTGPVMAANTVYVFFDPTCPHCAALWNAAQPLQNRLKIVWMPIGLLRSSSGPQGATILSAKDPIAAMTENETSVLAHGGGITVSQSLSDDIVAKVKANTDIFKSLGAESVPLIVYRNGKNGQFGKHDGAVSTEQLAEMAGL